MRGREYCGYCPAKRETFVGWRLHLVCTTDGLPVAFTLLPGAFHDLTPIHDLTVGLPEGAWVYGDKGDNSAPDEAVIRATAGGVLVPLHKDNMTPNTCAAQCGLRTHLPPRHRDAQQPTHWQGRRASARPLRRGFGDQSPCVLPRPRLSER